MYTFWQCQLSKVNELLNLKGTWWPTSCLLFKAAILIFLHRLDKSEKSIKLKRVKKYNTVDISKQHFFPLAASFPQGIYKVHQLNMSVHLKH